VLGKAKCANCALAEKQKNAGGEKIKSFRVGLCVVLLHFMSVCIVIVIIFFLSNVSLSGLQCLFTIAYNGWQYGKWRIAGFTFVPRYKT